MKKGFIFGLAVLFVFAMLGCSHDVEVEEPKGPSVITHTVTLNYNYPAEATENQPKDVKKTTGGNGKLSAADLALPAGTTPEGYNFKGWFTVKTATGGTEIKPDFAFSAATTIYARWDKVSKDPDDGENKDPDDGENKDPDDGENKDPDDGENKDPDDGENKDPDDGENKDPDDGTKNAPTESLVIDAASNPALVLSMHGNNNKATYESGVATYVSGGGIIGANEYALMNDSSLSPYLAGDESPSLAAVQFPAEEVDKHLYTKVIVYYDAIIPSSIVYEVEGEDDVTIYPDNPEGTLGGDLKKAYNSLDSLDRGEQYPDFEVGENMSLTWDLEWFDETGFSIQYNGSSDDYPRVNGWLLKITKLEFTTQELIDGTN